jgi:histidinol-phosphate aminotransferase
MKNWLLNIERKFDMEDKSEYSYILNQSERTTHIPHFQKFLQSINQEDFFFYPNTQKFKNKICSFYNVSHEQLFLCDGSDVGIKTIFESMTNKGNVITTHPSFPMYKIYSDLYQCDYIGIEHSDDYTISIDNMLTNVNSKTDLIILANPNSPMGECKNMNSILPLLKTNVPILIDEAYVEFSDNKSFINYINDYPNLIVTRTFSKAFGAAGCRIGMVFSNKKNIELISKFRQMYEISGVSMKYCSHLLDNYDIVDTYIQEVIKEKTKIVQLLQNYEVIDSNCNWVHFNNKQDNKNIIEIFEKHKVLAKFCSIPHDDRKNWCRLTIQPNLSNQKFMKEIV